MSLSAAFEENHPAGEGLNVPRMVVTLRGADDASWDGHYEATGQSGTYRQIGGHKCLELRLFPLEKSPDDTYNAPKESEAVCIQADPDPGGVQVTEPLEALEVSACSAARGLTGQHTHSNVQEAIENEDPVSLNLHRAAHREPVLKEVPHRLSFDDDKAKTYILRQEQLHLQHQHQLQAAESEATRKNNVIKEGKRVAAIEPMSESASVSVVSVLCHDLKGTGTNAVINTNVLQEVFDNAVWSEGQHTLRDMANSLLKQIVADNTHLMHVVRSFQMIADLAKGVCKQQSSTYDLQRLLSLLSMRYTTVTVVYLGDDKLDEMHILADEVSP